MFEKSNDHRLKVWLNHAEWLALQKIAAAKDLGIQQTIREYIHHDALKGVLVK
jgi:hypothetical protein